VGNAFRCRSPRIGKLPTQYACICALSLKGCRVERERQQADQILHVRELDELQDVVARVASSRRLVPTLDYICAAQRHSVVKTFFLPPLFYHYISKPRVFHYSFMLLQCHYLPLVMHVEFLGFITLDHGSKRSTHVSLHCKIARGFGLWKCA
jgi:hypothetical protein